MSNVNRNTITLEGTIVKKRSMGKYLAFADILISSQDDAYDDGYKIDNFFSENNNEKCIISCKFKRNSTFWDKSQDGTFPSKASSLPFGARVAMEVVKVVSMSTENVDGNQGLDAQNTSNNEKNKKNEIYYVVSWNMLTDPREIAFKESLIQTKQQQQTKDNMVDDGSAEYEHGMISSFSRQQTGLSCTDYLRSRADNYYKYNSPHSENKIKKKIVRKQLEKSSNNNDDSENNNIHGDKKSKNLRAKIFATWLIQEFGPELLDNVLDIAGGRGMLSIELALQQKTQCVVIDPLVRGKKKKVASVAPEIVVEEKEEERSNNSTTFSSSSLYPLLSSISKKDRKQLRKFKSPIPFHVAKPFSQNDVDEWRPVVQQSSCLVGLHPDECTEDILDVALRHEKSCAIVPCCVFPSLFPDRELKDGKKVIEYDSFLEYLLEKDDRLKIKTLGFKGRNKVIYYKANK